MTYLEIGKSVCGQPLQLFEFGMPRACSQIMMLGGVHGDEYEGVYLTRYLLSLYPTFISQNPKLNANLVFVPELNPDGVLMKTRHNARSVDLNRNLPTLDWTSETLNPRYPPGSSAGSEPENQALLAVLKSRKFDFIFSFHSWHPCLNVNGEGCEAIAQDLSQATGYEIKGDMGYSTPGCLGTYTGLERKIPTITYEIERGLSLKAISSLHADAIFSTLLKHYT